VSQERRRGRREIAADSGWPCYVSRSVQTSEGWICLDDSFPDLDPHLLGWRRGR